jgi:hypothetical protein
MTCMGVIPIQSKRIVKSSEITFFEHHRSWYNYDIITVSFNDVSHDGNNDVIIISALNKNLYQELYETKVYLSNLKGRSPIF